MGVGSINVWGDATRFNMLNKGANCKLLIHSDAADATHVFTDSVGTHTPAETGNTQHDTAQIRSYLGKSSILFDGDGDSLGIPDHADFNFGTGALTIDFWVRFSAVTGIHTLYYQAGANDDRVWFFVDHVLGKICMQVVSGGTNIVNQYITWAPLVDTWYHVALIRGWGGTAASWSVCINGTSIGTFTANVTMPDLNGTVSFGGGLSTTDIYDFSASAHKVTVVNDVVMSATQAKFGNKSISFPGTSDALTLADSVDWEISSNTNYTIDFWVRLTSHAANMCFLDHYQDGSVSTRLQHNHTTGLNFLISNGGNVVNITGGEIADSNWHHVAMCKVASVYSLYLDGTRTATATVADVVTQSGTLYIGSDDDDSDEVIGYMDELRISSAAVFGSGATITIPTAPPLPDTSTLLLLRSDGTDLAGWMTEIRVVKGTAMWTKNFKVPIGKYT
jgi:hypothetical protein